MGMNEDFDALRKIIQEADRLSTRELRKRRKDAQLNSTHGTLNDPSASVWRDHVAVIEKELASRRGTWPLRLSVISILIALAAFIQRFF